MTLDDVWDTPSNDGAPSLDEEMAPHGRGDVPLVKDQQTSMEAR